MITNTKEKSTAASGGITLCNVCNCEDIRLYLRWKGLNVLKCVGCGTVFTHPQPDDLDVQYDASYFKLYARRRLFRLRRADTRLRKIELVKSPGRILDIGCSLGYFVEAAEARGWDGYGVEISPHAAGVAVDSGLKVKSGTLERARYEDGFFDCVTMWDVLEHVPDPTAHMLEVRRILKPDGLVVIGTPNISHPAARWKMKSQTPQWRHFKPAEHIFYFTPLSVRVLLQKCGFMPVRPSLAPWRGSISTIANEALSRMVPVKDVMVVYGKVNDEQI